MTATDAIRDLFEQQALPLRQYLFGQAYHLTHGPDEAEDLVQETFARGLERFHQFKQGTNIKAWLSRILANEFINQYRKRRCRVQPASIDGLEGTVAAEIQEDVQHELETVPPAQLAEHEGFLQSLDQRLKQGLESMSRKYRDAFLLTTIGNLSYHEVARKLKIPTGTVMSRLHRARVALRQAWLTA
jgi:RNA polymerase sigma-70 factor (ECF subfamily)